MLLPVAVCTENSAFLTLCQQSVFSVTGSHEFCNLVVFLLWVIVVEIQTARVGLTTSNAARIRLSLVKP